MKRLTSILAGLGIVALIAVAGCSKEKANENPATPAAGEGAGAEQTQASANAAATPEKPGAAAPAQPGATGATMTKEQVAEKTLAMMNKMNEVVNANKDNCDAMAEELGKIVEENKDLKEVGKQVMGNDPEAQKWFEENYKDKFMAAMSQMMQGMQSCQGNEKMQQVFSHMSN